MDFLSMKTVEISEIVKAKRIRIRGQFCEMYSLNMIELRYLDKLPFVVLRIL